MSSATGNVSLKAFPVAAGGNYKRRLILSISSWNCSTHFCIVSNSSLDIKQKSKNSAAFPITIKQILDGKLNRSIKRFIYSSSSGGFFHGKSLILFFSKNFCQSVSLWAASIWTSHHERGLLFVNVHFSVISRICRVLHLGQSVCIFAGYNWKEVVVLHLEQPKSCTLFLTPNNLPYSTRNLCDRY